MPDELDVAISGPPMVQPLFYKLMRTSFAYQPVAAPAFRVLLELRLSA